MKKQIPLTIQQKRNIVQRILPLLEDWVSKRAEYQGGMASYFESSGIAKVLKDELEKTGCDLRFDGKYCFVPTLDDHMKIWLMKIYHRTSDTTAFCKKFNIDKTDRFNEKVATVLVNLTIGIMEGRMLSGPTPAFAVLERGNLPLDHVVFPRRWS